MCHCEPSGSLARNDRLKANQLNANKLMVNSYCQLITANNNYKSKI